MIIDDPSRLDGTPNAVVTSARPVQELVEAVDLGGLASGLARKDAVWALAGRGARPRVAFLICDSIPVSLALYVELHPVV